MVRNFLMFWVGLESSPVNVVPYVEVIELKENVLPITQEVGRQSQRSPEINVICQLFEVLLEISNKIYRSYLTIVI